MDLLDPTFLTWAFAIGGLLLIGTEKLVPGGVAGFLGIGGLVIAGIRSLGLLLDPWTAFLTWIFLSIGMTIALRPLAMRYVRGETSMDLTDEDAEAMGKTVEVVEEVGEEEPGRIRYRGAEWDACTVEGRLPKGAKARLVYRDNLTWVVEAADDSDLDAELSEAIGEDLTTEDQEGDRDASDRSSDSSGLDYDPSARVQE